MSSFYGKGVNVQSQEQFVLHVTNGESHTTNQEREKWNKKVSLQIDNNHGLEFFAEND